MDKIEFGKRLKKMREKKAWTQYKLAKELGIQNNQNSIKRWEQGEVLPRSDTITKIADLLEVSSDYLVGLSDEPDIKKAELEKYKKSEKFVKEILSKWVDRADEKDINLQFIYELRKLVDFNEDFAQDGFLTHKSKMSMYESYDRYEKELLPATVKLDDNDPLSVLQITRNGETHNMNVFDLLFLKDLQDEIVNCTLKFMNKRKKEIEKELLEANKLYTEKLEKNTIVNDKGEKFIAHNSSIYLNADEINNIVRYKIYKD